MKKTNGVKSFAALGLVLTMGVTLCCPVLAETVTADETNQQEETSWSQEIESALSGRDYVEGQVLALIDSSKDSGLVTLDDSEEIETLADISEETVEETLDVNSGASSIQLITSDEKTTEELLYELAEDPSVLYAEPNYIYQAESTYEMTEDLTVLEDETEEPETKPETKDFDTLSDSDFAESTTQIEASKESIGDLTGYQWGYKIDKTQTATNYTDLLTMNVPYWNDSNYENVSGVRDGDETVDAVVCVMDTGIDYTHPDLKDVMIDDMTQYNSEGGQYGYNAIAASRTEYTTPVTDPIDDGGHGTHCAGIIAAKTNDFGTSGVANGKIKLCAVKILDNSGHGSSVAIMKGFNYLITAVKNGLKLVALNMSFGGTYIDQMETFAVNELGKLGVVSCIASGNDNQDNDDITASASSDSVSPYAVIVDAANPTYMKTDYSSYGQTTTNIFSPGDAILSTVPYCAGSYIAYLDKNPVAFESFRNETQSIKIYATNQTSYTAEELKNLSEADGSVTSADSYDNDGASYVIHCTGGETKNLVIKIPVTKDNIKNVTNFGASFKSTGEYTKVTTSALCDGGEKITENITTTGQRPTKIWSNNNLSLKNIAASAPLAYVDGAIYVQVKIEDLSTSGEEFDLYIDNIGIGKAITNYNYYQGTSMATPAVTGAAAILASVIDANDLDDEIPVGTEAFARKLANTLKSSVHCTDNYEKLCSSRGYLNFAFASEPVEMILDTGSISFEGVSTPVINEVTVENHQLVIRGNYFGDSGENKPKVILGSEELTVVSWNNTAIKAQLPADFKNGRYYLYITSGINARDTVARVQIRTEGGVSAFEGEIELPDKLKSASIKMAASDTDLYVLASDLKVNAGVLAELWGYNFEKEEWTDLDTLNPLPGLDSPVTITTYKGYPVVCYNNSYKDDEGLNKYTVYFKLFDTEKNQWRDINIGTDPDTGKEYSLEYSYISATSQGIIAGTYKSYKGEDEEGEIQKNQVLLLEIDDAALKASGTINCKTTPLLEPKNSTGEIFSIGDSFCFLKSSGTYVTYTWDYDKEEYVKSNQFNLNKAGKLSGDAIATPLGFTVVGMGGNTDGSRGYDIFYVNENGEYQSVDNLVVAYDNLYDVRAAYGGGMLFAEGASYTGSQLNKLYYTKSISCTHKDTKDVVTQKATPSKSGIIANRCIICGEKYYDVYGIKSVTLAKTEYVYNGKLIMPQVTVKDLYGDVIDSSNYNVTYSGNCKTPGSYKVTVTFKGNLYSGSTAMTFKIVPKATKIKKTKATSKKITVKWKKQAQCTGYQIQYSTNKNFKSAKTVTIKSNKTLKKTIKKLKGNKKYYVRVRTYSNVEGKNYYSSWSATKTVKTKK